MYSKSFPHYEFEAPRLNFRSIDFFGVIPSYASTTSPLMRPVPLTPFTIPSLPELPMLRSLFLVSTSFFGEIIACC
jgi:hypothetical protein